MRQPTHDGTFAVQYGEKYFLISGDLKRLIRELNMDEFNEICEVEEPTPEFELALPPSLVVQLDKASAFIEDAAMLSFFKNEAICAVYPFASSVEGPISILKLSENRGILLSNQGNYHHTASAGNTIETNKFTFYNLGKELLGTQHNRETKEFANEHTTEGYEGETMIESIARMGIARDLAYIFHSHYNNGDMNNRVESRAQVIYINDLSLDEILSEVRKVAAESAAS